jgi:hypothetical protein
VGNWRIATVESLQQHLQWAIELEHCTIPPYLCALYSLDSDRNPEATEVVYSVLVEEMLHLALVANLLNAVGGRPRLDSPTLLAPYPRCLPHGDRAFEVPLLPFGRDALEVFKRIERPAPPGAEPESDAYETISQFYAAIRQGLVDLFGSLGEASVFGGDPARQVTGELFSVGAERVVVVTSLDTALAALGEIVEQGEGASHSEVWDGDSDMFHPEREQVAHYYRFKELELGRRYRRGDSPQSGPSGDSMRVDWEGVRPMRANPRSADYPADSPIREAQAAFNRSYCAILALLEQAFSGKPTQLPSAICAMYALKGQAQALMQLPSGDGVTTAGPTFEYVVAITEQPADRSLVA